MRRRTVTAIVLCSAALCGCLWVKPTSAGKEVREATADQVYNCERLGTIAANTRATALGLPRDKETMREEQVNLARNDAPSLGGDTIVADGPSKGGSQNFIVYRCGAGAPSTATPPAHLMPPTDAIAPGTVIAPGNPIGP